MKLLETRKKFYANTNSDFTANNLKVIKSMMNIAFEKLAVAINNICVSSSQAINDILLNDIF